MLVYPHLRKLQARLLANEQTGKLPSHALEYLRAGSIQFSTYLRDDILPNIKNMRTDQLACAWQTALALLHLSTMQHDYVIPKELQNLRTFEAEIKEAIQTSSLTSIHSHGCSVVHLWDFNSLLATLRNLSTRNWYNLDAPSLLHIWGFLIQEPQRICSRFVQLGESMPDILRHTHRHKALSRVTKVWTLHQVLHLYTPDSLDKGSAEGHQLAETESTLYHALKFLFSKSVLALSKCEQSKVENVHQISAMCLGQIQTMLELGLLMDRQVIAAILHLYHMGDATVRSTLHNSDILSEAWRQWSARQLVHRHEPQDLVLLVGFLRTVPQRGIRQVEPLSAWKLETMDMATAVLGLATDTSNFETARSSKTRAFPARTARTRPQSKSAVLANSSSSSVISDLLRALAITSLRVDRIDIALDRLHDARLISRHAISVLNELACYLGPESDIPVPERKRLIAICAKFAEGLARNVRTYIERERVQLLVPFIELLSYHLHHEEAGALVVALQNPAHIGEAVLSEFLRKLSFHRQGVLALAIYNKIPPLDVTDYHRAALLSSPWKGLSDLVWEQLFEDGKKKQLDVRLLNARLLHYANQPEKTGVSSRRILLDHADAINVLGVEPTTDTDNILFGVLIKAGRLRHAYDVYERLRKAASAHTSTILNHFLMAAPKPRADWRSIGPVAQHNRVVKALRQMTEENDMPINGVTANILLRANLKWGEMSADAVWAALGAGLEDADKRDWTTELRPLFRMVVRFFIKRNMKEDARKAVLMMTEMRMSRIGR